MSPDKLVDENDPSALATDTKSFINSFAIGPHPAISRGELSLFVKARK